MLFPDQSADLTRKSIKHKLTDICPFIAPLKNVLFLFYLHSLVWIWTHLVEQRWIKLQHRETADSCCDSWQDLRRANLPKLSLFSWEIFNLW
jgi:hypothetical protein